MQTQVFKNQYVACPFQIQMCDLQGGFSLGTAFFYECEGATFIVTNWHNVTGKHSLTGAPATLQAESFVHTGKMACGGGSCPPCRRCQSNAFPGSED